MKTIEEAINENCKKSGITGYGKTTYNIGFSDAIKFAQQWISVDDELPEEEGDYLVKWTNLLGQKSIQFVYWSDDKKNWDAKYYECVTHWRPIELK